MSNDTRAQLRMKQDQLLELCEARGLDDSLAISGEFAGCPAVWQLRDCIWPDWEAAIDHAIYTLARS